MKNIKIVGNTQSLEIKLANSFFNRFVGLMGQNQVPRQGLLLKPCSSVHMFFMKIPLDIIYLSKDNTVLYIETLQPWKIGAFVKQTKAILEIQANTCPFKIGEKLKIIE